MKVVVTGGAGYIGSHATYKLIEEGHDVVVIDSLWRGFKENVHPKATFYKVDIRNTDEIIKIFEKEKNINGVLHFAGSIVVSESMKKPLDYFDNNVCSTVSLLRAMKKSDINNIIYSSTAAVYESNGEKLISEDGKTNPINPYAFSKLAGEMLIKSFGLLDKNNYLIFRYFNVAGAHENKKIGIRGKSLTHLLPSVLETVIGLRPKFEIFGNDYDTRDGTCIRDFIHVNDLVSAHILGLKWIIKNKKSTLINLGSGSGFSVKEVIDTTDKELKTKVKFVNSSRREGDAPIVLANISRAERLLGWKPKRSLSEIIRSDYQFRKDINGK